VKRAREVQNKTLEWQNSFFDVWILWLTTLKYQFDC